MGISHYKAGEKRPKCCAIAGILDAFYSSKVTIRSLTSEIRSLKLKIRSLTGQIRPQTFIGCYNQTRRDGNGVERTTAAIYGLSNAFISN